MPGTNREIVKHFWPLIAPFVALIFAALAALISAPAHAFPCSTRLECAWFGSAAREAAITRHTCIERAYGRWYFHTCGGRTVFARGPGQWRRVWWR